jgi:predicted trehalose synthase
MFEGRALLRQIHQLDLDEVGADAELDIVAAGTALAEFHQLSLAAMDQRCIDAGIKTEAEARAQIDRLAQPDFLGCGFAHIGVWGRRPTGR